MPQRKKKNKFLPLIILTALLLVLVIAYSALSKANRSSVPNDGEQSNEKLMIADNDYTTVTTLAYSKAGWEDELCFKLGNTGWTYSADPLFPLNQVTVTQMAGAIARIGVECAVDAGNDADYGLDEPAYTIRVNYADGSAHTYKIGDYNNFNSAYYFSADGERYMVAAGLLDYFNYTLADLIQLDTIPASDWSDISYVNSVTVRNGGNEVTLTEEEAKMGAIELIKSLSTDSWADYYADESERAEMGLDGARSVTVKYKQAKTLTDESGNSSTTYLDTSYTIEFGAEVELGGTAGVYFSPAKSSIVYSGDAGVIEAILALVQ